MAHGVVCHFDLPHMAQKVADWTRREGRPRADEMAHGAVCRFELPHVAENNRRVTRVDSSLWPQRTVPKFPSGTNGCQTLKTATLNTSYFCQKRPLCQPPPSPTPPPNSHFVRKVKLRLAYRLAFVINTFPDSKINHAIFMPSSKTHSDYIFRFKTPPLRSKYLHRWWQASRWQKTDQNMVGNKLGNVHFQWLQNGEVRKLSGSHGKQQPVPVDLWLMNVPPCCPS